LLSEAIFLVRVTWSRQEDYQNLDANRKRSNGNAWSNIGKILH